MKKILSIVLSLILIVSVFVGCGKKDQVIDFIYPFSANVNSYDPQVASTNDEFLIIENTFEGLIRVNDNGEVVSGMADSWNISDDGLTYTFHIREGMKWDINTDKYKTGDKAGEFKDSRLRMLGREFNPDITAKDFVFALQRAVDPITDCPSFASISCIKNANLIHSGKLGVNQLGVVANDDHNLTITLEHKDSTFMQTLASAVAMPCNEEFFYETDGRYGLDVKYTLFNGQFYVSQILETSYLLKNNPQYTGPAPTKAKELTLKIVDNESNEEDLLERIESGYYDAAFISGKDSEAIKNTQGITYAPYQDTTWAFILNENDEVLQSKTMRKAFCEGFSRPDVFDEEYLESATNLIPSSCLINGNNAVKAIGATVTQQNQNASIKDWKKAIDLLDTTNVELTILTPEAMEGAVKRLLQGIQAGLGSSLTNLEGEAINLSLKVEVLNEKEIKNAIITNEYDIAFLPLKATGNSAISFINSVADNRYVNINTKAVEKIVAKAQNQNDLNKIALQLQNAEKVILKDYTLCPIVYETSYYVSAKGVENIQFHTGTGRVSFVNATRK